MKQTGDEDSELARVLTELRRTDEASAPSFAQTLARARASTAATRTRRVFRLAAALGALLLIGITWALWKRPAVEGALPARALSLATWKAPSDSLLSTPGRSLASSLPEIVPRLPDYSGLATVSTSRTPGAESRD